MGFVWKIVKTAVFIGAVAYSVNCCSTPNNINYHYNKLTDTQKKTFIIQKASELDGNGISGLVSDLKPKMSSDDYEKFIFDHYKRSDELYSNGTKIFGRIAIDQGYKGVVKGKQILEGMVNDYQ